ncbi:hypothetical protein ElyMa_003540100 [Elysia marginata]|uniref:Uncharacterized protein n=1 Tax=Elysia marginata TaxID=1093978 RepID=A0AAV4EKI4_9GAST|nr:hypothetical protein ElyMa_003540100 [Elysia marginata]
MHKQINQRGILPAGLYQDVQTAVERLNGALSRVIRKIKKNKSEETPIIFKYEEDSMRASLEVNDPAIMTRLSPKLCEFLDIEDKEYQGTAVATSRHPLSNIFGQCAVYIYTDLIEPRHVDALQSQLALSGFCRDTAGELDVMDGDKNKGFFLQERNGLRKVKSVTWCAEFMLIYFTKRSF